MDSDRLTTRSWPVWVEKMGTLHFCQKVVNSSNSKHKHPSGFPDIFLKTSLENG